jgi:hypothetical protein
LLRVGGASRWPLRVALGVASLLLGVVGLVLAMRSLVPADSAFSAQARASERAQELLRQQLERARKAAEEARADLCPAGSRETVRVLVDSPRPPQWCTCDCKTGTCTCY